MAGSISLCALRELFAHNYWARDRQLLACAALTSEQFLRPLGNSFPSVRTPWFTYWRWSGSGSNAGADGLRACCSRLKNFLRSWLFAIGGTSSSRR